MRSQDDAGPASAEWRGLSGADVRMCQMRQHDKRRNHRSVERSRRLVGRPRFAAARLTAASSRYMCKWHLACPKGRAGGSAYHPRPAVSMRAMVPRQVKGTKSLPIERTALRGPQCASDFLLCGALAMELIQPTGSGQIHGPLGRLSGDTVQTPEPEAAWRTGIPALRRSLPP
jgi:hypothetical protein